MKKAIDKFDEHEVDTAKRDYPMQLADVGRSATAKMSKVDLEKMLRKESGTRPAVDRGAIDRHLGIDASPPLDPHARPTIDVFSVVPPMPAIPITEGPLESDRPPALGATPQTSESFPAIEAPPRSSGEVARSSASSAAPLVAPTPRWVVPAILVGFAIFIGVALTLGFFLGRVTGR